MAKAWEPSGASVPLEKLMEEKSLPESDRDEIRRFSEFLQRRKDKRDGKTLPPMPEGTKEWALGIDEEGGQANGHAD